MTPRLFAPGALALAIEGTAISLSKEVAHHALRVLRRKAGDPVVLFDGEGRAAQARIARSGGRGAGADSEVVIEVRLADEPLPDLAIVLGQCISAAEKMDWTIEKAVELGVSAIVPLQSARSIVRLDAARAERRLQHWERLVIAACAQCGRNRLPRVLAPVPFADWVAGPLPALTPMPTNKGARSGSEPEVPPTRVHLDPDGDESLPAMLARHDRRPSTIVLACGPEAGFDESEIRLLASSGWQGIRLGPRILRTETAAMTAVAMIQGWLGDLR